MKKEGNPQDYRQFITSNPNILFGKPAIKDTRIAVEHILDELAGGTTIEQLLVARWRLVPLALKVGAMKEQLQLVAAGRIASALRTQ